MLMRAIAKKWAVNDPFPKKPSLMVKISYATTKHGPTEMSDRVMALTLALMRLADIYKSDPVVVSGTFSKNPTGFSEEEWLKSKLPKIVLLGDVSSTTDECQATKKVAETLMVTSIVVIADGSHSRRAKIVWKHMFPGVEICFRSTPAWEGSDPENPMWFQRNWKVWLLVNIAAYPLYRWFPGAAWFVKHNPSQPV